MHALYEEFSALLDAEDRDGCVHFALDRLQNGDLDVVTLYNELLTPSLYADFCEGEDKDICIWKEHVRTSIVRTIIEVAYPYVIRERDAAGSRKQSSVAVVCPPEEWHDLGARMVADFFTLAGFKTTFVGANMPRDEIINAIRYLRPDYVAVSITDYYNLIAARRVVAEILELRSVFPFKLILGGQACRSNPGACQAMQADYYLETSVEIMKLGEA